MEINKNLHICATSVLLLAIAQGSIADPIAIIEATGIFVNGTCDGGPQGQKAELKWEINIQGIRNQTKNGREDVPGGSWLQLSGVSDDFDLAKTNEVTVAIILTEYDEGGREWESRSTQEKFYKTEILQNGFLQKTIQGWPDGGDSKKCDMVVSLQARIP